MKKIEMKFVKEPTFYASPEMRVVSIASRCSMMVAGSTHVEGTTIDDVTEEDNEFFN